jgi:hypothetical protein
MTAAKYLSRQLHWPSVAWALLATIALAVLIKVGSRNLADFDAALVGYTFACLFSWFGVVYRYCVWLSKPPTRRYWRRGWQLLFMPKTWKLGTRMRLLFIGIWTRIVAQNFIYKRGKRRWLGHKLLAWGCVLAFGVTFPLVFGWIHFEQGAIKPEATYKVIFFGFHVSTLPLRGVLSWFVFHALVVSSFMVIPGVMIMMARRMFDMGAVAVERLGRDFVPLILLFAISASGLLLWVSYEWFHGQFYNALATFHAITVIAFLIHLPFGKLFHIFQRPASLGVVFYRAVGEMGEPAVCPVTGEAFASKLQTGDLNNVLPELGFDYAPPATAADTALHWNEISPRGRRMLIARAHNAVRHGKFD